MIKIALLRKKIVATFLLLALFFGAIFLFSGENFSVRAFADGEFGGLSTTYQPEGQSVNPPTVVLDVSSKSDLITLQNETRKPSNAILRFNESAKVVDENGEEIETFATVCNEVLKNQIIPVVLLETDASADLFLRYLKTHDKVFDLTVASKNPEIVKKVREENFKVRGAIFFEGEVDPQETVETLNENLATIAIVDGNGLTREKVTYIHSRFKTVWAKGDFSLKSDLYDCIFSGVYGLVTNDHITAYDVLETLPENGLTRSSLNVAHRGLPGHYSDNSLTGAKKATELGATHVELDCYLTKDNEIVLCHDVMIDSVSTGSGNIENFTLSELKNFDLVQFGEPEPFASLEDVMKALKGKGVIIVLEVKSGKTALLTVLKNLLDEYDFYDQITVISYNLNILNEMKKVLPSVPTSYLGFNDTHFKNLENFLSVMGQYNVGADMPYANIPDGKTFNKQFLTDRGIVGWYYTFTDIYGFEAGMWKGFVGLTNNAADDVGKRVQYYKVKPQKVKTLQFGDKITLIGVDYTGKEKEVEGKVFYMEETEDSYKVVGSFEDDYNTHFTQISVLEKGSQTSSPSGGCKSSLDGSLFTVFLGAAALSVARLKRRKVGE